MSPSQELFKTLFILSLAPILLGAGAANAPVTVEYLEWDNAVREFDLSLVTARADSRNMEIDWERAKAECDTIRALLNKGAETTKNLKACEQRSASLETQVHEVRHRVGKLERNKHLAVLRRDGESSGQVNVEQLAATYVEKWREDLALARRYTRIAEQQAKTALEYLEWVQTMRKKGYATHDEYERAVASYSQLKNSHSSQLAREKQMELSLTEAETTLQTLRVLQQPSGKTNPS